MRIGVPTWIALAMATSACEGDGGDSGGGAAQAAPDAGAPAAPSGLQPASEHSTTALRLPMDAAAFAAVVEPLFAAAAAPDGQAEHSPLAGFTLVVRADPRTPEQFVLAVRLDPVTSADGAPIELLAVPGSRVYAAIFLEAVAQSIAADAAERAAGRTPEPWRVAWQVVSDRGGSMKVELDGEGASPELRLELNTPRVALAADRFGQPALDRAPRETISALVPFRLDYPTFRAAILGVLGGGGEGTAIDGGCDGAGFDGATAPHDWYRLCFRQSDEPPDTGAAVVHVRTRAGRTLPVVVAPGSVRGVALWIAALDRLIGNVQAGAARNFESRYDYRDPDRQGTAVIVARAVDGRVSISHSFETPPSVLVDTEFVPVPDFDPAVEAPTPCSAVGGEPGPRGVLVMRFAAAEALRRFGGMPWPPGGDIHGAIYHAADFGLTGPVGGAAPVQSFRVDDVALGTDPGAQVVESAELPAGDYKVTAFLDLNRNSDPADPSPEAGDPAVLPLAPVKLGCTRQPHTVEFAVRIP